MVSWGRWGVSGGGTWAVKDSQPRIGTHTRGRGTDSAAGNGK